MWPVWASLAIVTAVLLAESPAHASTFRKEKRPIDPQAWRGCGVPPADMRPRPIHACGDQVTDTSSGKPRQRRVTELSGSQDKAGAWRWAYLLDDGTAAGASTLRRVEAQ
jgi:hypothetical protein